MTDQHETILGPPGTGKTQTNSNRIRDCIEQGISPDAAETKAYKVNAFSAQPTWKKRDPWATFQSWLREDKAAAKPGNDRVNDTDWAAMAAQINQRSDNDAIDGG